MQKEHKAGTSGGLAAFMDIVILDKFVGAVMLDEFVDEFMDDVIFG